MIRTLTASAILSALISGVGVYTIKSPLWQTMTGLRSGDAKQTADVEAAIENGSICTITVDMTDVAAKYNVLLKEYAKLRTELAAEVGPEPAEAYGLGHTPHAEEVSAADIRN